MCSCVGGFVVKLCIYIVHGVCGSSGSSVYIFVCVSIVWCWCCIVHNYVEHRYECEHVYVVWKTVAGCVCGGRGGGQANIKAKWKIRLTLNHRFAVCLHTCWQKGMLKRRHLSVSGLPSDNASELLCHELYE